MYQQKIKTGEEDVEVFVEYAIVDDLAVVEKIYVAGTGAEVPLGIFDLPQLERMGELLDKNHDAVVRELYDEYRIDQFTERQADREMYA